MISLRKDSYHLFQGLKFTNLPSSWCHGVLSSPWAFLLASQGLIRNENRKAGALLSQVAYWHLWGSHTGWHPLGWFMPFTARILLLSLLPAEWGEAGNMPEIFFNPPLLSHFSPPLLLLLPSPLRHLRRPITGAGYIWGHNWTGRQSGKEDEGAEEASWAVNPAVPYICQGGTSLRVKLGSKHCSAIISGKAPWGLGS